jgi:hypothetical protein
LPRHCGFCADKRLNLYLKEPKDLQACVELVAKRNEVYHYLVNVETLRIGWATSIHHYWNFCCSANHLYCDVMTSLDGHRYQLAKGNYIGAITTIHEDQGGWRDRREEWKGIGSTMRDWRPLLDILAKLPKLQHLILRADVPHGVYAKIRQDPALSRTSLDCIMDEKYIWDDPNGQETVKAKLQSPNLSAISIRVPWPMVSGTVGVRQHIDTAVYTRAFWQHLSRATNVRVLELAGALSPDYILTSPELNKARDSAQTSSCRGVDGGGPRY